LPEYLLGIDNGNTVSKAAIFDLEGHEIQVANCLVESRFPHKGWTEIEQVKIGMLRCTPYIFR
jgi:L-xylulokinase